MSESTSAASEFDPRTSDSLCAAVVDAVAAAEGVAPTDLDPLQHTVDCDALEDLNRSMGADAAVEFRYAGYRVRVGGDGAVDVFRR